MGVSGLGVSFRHWGTKTVISRCPRALNQSTASLIPAHENTSLLPWLQIQMHIVSLHTSHQERNDHSEMVSFCIGIWNWQRDDISRGARREKQVCANQTPRWEVSSMTKHAFAGMLTSAGWKKKFSFCICHPSQSCLVFDLCFSAKRQCGGVKPHPSFRWKLESSPKTWPMYHWILLSQAKKTTVKICFVAFCFNLASVPASQQLQSSITHTKVRKSFFRLT